MMEKKILPLFMINLMNVAQINPLRRYFARKDACVYRANIIIATLIKTLFYRNIVSHSRGKCDAKTITCDNI